MNPYPKHNNPQNIIAMDKRTKDFLKVLPTSIWAFLTVITSAKCMNTLDGMGIFCGIVTLLGTGYFVYKTYKEISD